MRRVKTPERAHWREQAVEYGFRFHTMYGEPYWDESAYYQFTLAQIENDIEDPTQAIHQMCLEVVARVVRDEALLRRFQIPEFYWDALKRSWDEGEPSLYSRIDLVYDAQGGPAKLLENNADTPTSLYETGFWQWLWLEDKIQSGELPAHSDQYNSLQDRLIERFVQLQADAPQQVLHLACCKDTEEDRATVQYLEDCARQSGIECRFVFVEDIGHGEGDCLTDLDNHVIQWLFKLYPWEFMMHEQYGPLVPHSGVHFIEPLWKSLISNKAILPMLWQMFPDHPNLLPAYFEDDPARHALSHYVKKPIFSREGANVSVVRDGDTVFAGDGPYGEEGFIYQAYCPLPQYEDNYTLIGSWLIDDAPAGMSVREDKSPVTQDLSRFIPHVIVD